MKYFFDNCISPKFAGMLRALGEDVVALRDEFEEDCKDVDIFERLKQSSFDVFVSTDTSQLRREHEARALKQAHITALYFGPFFTRMKLWEQAAWIVKRWPNIKTFASCA